MVKSLDVPTFANSEYDKRQKEKEAILKQNHVTYKNKSAMKKNADRSWTLTKLGVAAVMGVIVFGAINGVIQSHQYESVVHKYDTYSSETGLWSHGHELDKEHFVQDYKIVNEEATFENIEEAIDDGQYRYYADHDGKIKIDKELQGEPLDNDEVIEFSDQFLEEYSVKKHK